MSPQKTVRINHVMTGSSGRPCYESQAMTCNGKILILGLGNTLLSDDGVGVHIVNRLHKRFDGYPHIKCVEGGTLGLSLLPEMDGTSGFIAVDAAQLNQSPGTVITFENEEMDEQLSGRKSTSHEVALADLMDTALLTGTRPQKRALVAIQPESTSWGETLKKPVASAMQQAESDIISLIERWDI